MPERIVLIVAEKGGVSREEQFEANEIMIGRVQGNDLVLPKGNISKRHARIVVRDGKAIVVDLKTTNGTYVNGKRINSPQVLKESDKIYLGDFTLTVRLGGGAPTARVVPPPPPIPTLPVPPPPSALAIPPPGAGPRLTLEIQGRDLQVHSIARAVIGIGRHPQNDVVVDDRSLSRFHARIERRGAQFFLVDCGAQNGMFVDGQRVQGEHNLTEGDRIECGRARLTVWGIGAASATPSTHTPTQADDKAAAKRVVEALRDPRTREVLLSEDAPVRAVANVVGLCDVVTSRRVILAVVHVYQVPIDDARPVFDGPSPFDPSWRVTAQSLEGAPVRARFRRAAAVSLDDDLDPIPPS